jgi:hypothetical protein
VSQWAALGTGATASGAHVNGGIDGGREVPRSAPNVGEAVV